jgi:quercetin 2,3-dioxygenase
MPNSQSAGAQVLRSAERGFADHGWLKSFHTFSFADYYNPKYNGFGNLRVINQDSIEGGTGFATHPHRDMEIISYVLEGSLQHQDSMGNKTIIKPGEVQRMSAGTGITHSEHNFEKHMPTKFFQIWIMPNTLGLSPSYDQKDFSQEISKGKPVQVLGPIQEKLQDKIVTCAQNIELWITKTNEKLSLDFANFSTRKLAWIQIISGTLNCGNTLLNSGDAIYGECLKIGSVILEKECHVLIFLQ